MIQNSMNQLLGIAGALGTYAKSERIKGASAEMNTVMDAYKNEAGAYPPGSDMANAAEQGAKDVMRGYGAGKGNMLTKLTQPKAITDEAKAKFAAIDNQKAALTNKAAQEVKSEKVGEPAGESITIGGEKVNVKELPPKMQQFLTGQASPQEQARATAMQSFASNGMARVQQAQDLANLKDILQSRHSKGANRKEALDYIEKREKENK